MTSSIGADFSASFSGAHIIFRFDSPEQVKSQLTSMVLKKFPNTRTSGTLVRTGQGIDRLIKKLQLRVDTIMKDIVAHMSTEIFSAPGDQRTTVLYDFQRISPVWAALSAGYLEFKGATTGSLTHKQWAGDLRSSFRSESAASKGTLEYKVGFHSLSGDDFSKKIMENEFGGRDVPPRPIVQPIMDYFVVKFRDEFSKISHDVKSGARLEVVFMSGIDTQDFMLAGG